MDEMNQLRHIFKGTFLTEHTDMIPYLKDASYFEGAMPLAVAIAENAEQIGILLKYCSEHRINVTTRSGGSSLTGSSTPSENTVVLSMSGMNRILETHIEDGYVVAEPGVRLDELNQHLTKYNFFYPPDPASSMAATVGGSISTNAGGLRACSYGTTKEWILGLEIVLPNGKKIEAGGRTLKRTKGYDITALMAGNEGTLAVITKAFLKIWPIPEEVGRILAYFKDSTSMSLSLTALKSAGIIPYIAEFMDKLSLDAVKLGKGIDYPEGSNYLLMVDIASTHESIDRMLRDASEILKKQKPIEVKITRDPEEMSKMYEARKGLYSSSLGVRDSKDEYIVIGDVVVPPSELPTALKRAEEALKELNLRCLFFGHIGDGNIHANIFADLSSKEHMNRVDQFQMRLAHIALDCKGSVSAEHGIGLEKKGLLIEELKARDSMELIDLMRGVKKAFDPELILNRGKIFD